MNKDLHDLLILRPQDLEEKDFTFNDDEGDESSDDETTIETTM